MDRFRYLLSLILIASVGYSAPIYPKTTVADKKPHESILCNNESCGNVLFSSTSKHFENSSSLPVVPLPAIPTKEIMNSTKFRVGQKLLNFDESPDFAIQHNYDGDDSNIVFDEGNDGDRNSTTEYDGAYDVEQNTTFEDDAEPDSTPEDDAEQNASFEDNREQDATHEDDAEQNTDFEDDAEQNTAFDDDAERDNTSEEDAEPDSTPEDDAEQNTSFEDNPEQDATPEDDAEQNTDFEDDAEQNTAFDDDAERDNTPEEDAEQDSTPEDGAKQNTAFEDDAEQDITPEDDAEQSTTFEDDAEQNTIFQDNPELDTTSEDDDEQDSILKDHGENHGANFQGNATHYSVSVGYTACGTMHSDDEFIAALNSAQFDSATTNGNPNLNSLCNTLVTVVGPKGSIEVKIVDKCPGCNYGDLDLSEAAFKAVVGDLGIGRAKVTWKLL